MGTVQSTALNWKVNLSSHQECSPRYSTSSNESNLSTGYLGARGQREGGQREGRDIYSASGEEKNHFSFEEGEKKPHFIIQIVYIIQNTSLKINKM